VAFNILLAGVPFILLLASALGYLFGESVDTTTVLVQRVVERLLPPQMGVEGSMLDPVLADVQRTRVVFGIGGGLGFFWFSARLFGSLRAVMNSVFEHGRDRTFIRGVLWDLNLSVMTVVLMTVWVVISSWLVVSTGQVGQVLTEVGVRSDLLSGVELLLGRLLAMAVIVAIFAALYRWLPKRKTDWIPTLAGAVTAGGLFELARWIFGILIRAFPPDSVYTGTLGALVVVVFWTYYAALIFVLGAEVASAVHEELSPPALH
jgi:membrane protein